MNTEHAIREGDNPHPDILALYYLKERLILFLARSLEKSDVSRFNKKEKETQVDEAQKMIFVFSELVKEFCNPELHKAVLEVGNANHQAMENAIGIGKTKVNTSFVLLFIIAIVSFLFIYPFFL